MSKIRLNADRLFSPLLLIQPTVIQSLQMIGIALIAVSILYLLAANWWMLPKFIQLLIPQGLLLASALLSIRFTTKASLRQSLDTVAGLMLGLSLAVIGQIYQTGADSHRLFLLWTLLLLPWFYRPNIGVFAMFSVVSQLALYFYFKQSGWLFRTEAAYLLALNLLTGLTFLYALRYYPVLRYLFILLMVVISVSSMFHFIGSGSFWALGSALVLLILLTAYFYHRRKQLETSLLVAGLALSCSVLIFDLIQHYLQESAASLFILALLVFGWFAAVSSLLMKLLPKSKFSVIPLALGAWIAGIILAVLLLTYWKSFSLFMGVVFIAAAWLLIRTRSSIFLHQLAYCLWVCGQAAVLIHSELLTDNVLLVWLIQLGILLFTMLSRMHWWLVFLQLLLAYLLGMLALFSQFQGNPMPLVLSINDLILILVMLSAACWQESRYSKSLQLGMIAVLAATAVLQTAFQFGFYGILNGQQLDNLLLFYLLPVLWLLGFILLHRRQFRLPALRLISILGMGLIWLGYFEILIILLLMAQAIVSRQSLIQALSVLLLIFWLWMLYYQLGLSFLFKSLSIFVSGLMILLLVYLFRRPKMQIQTGEME